jgi:hypothetical protein
MIRMVSKTADVLADEHIETTEIVTHHSPDFGVTKLFWYGPPCLDALSCGTQECRNPKGSTHLCNIRLP